MTERDIFLAALDLTDPTERATFVDKSCAGNQALRDKVEALLRSHDSAGSFLGKPAVAAGKPDPDATVTNSGGHAANFDAESLTFLSPSSRPDSLGRLGHYEVLQVLGRGGFGIVFRAFDDVLQRVVALKVLAPQVAMTSPARKRFLREAQSSAKVRHENVVQIYDVKEQPLPYLVMEFIPGETLQQRLDRTGPLDVPEALRIGHQIAEGLAAAHATDLIHRDIKPGNILLEGGQHKVKITDFGLARAADDASISQSGLIAGTPMYMAPEQAQGQPLDQRADLFSLGSVLYQIVSGRPPFRANNTVAVLKRVAEDTPRDIREIIPETPRWLCDIIAKLHEKNPDDRYQSAREVADVLADCEQQLKMHGALRDIARIPASRPPARPRRRSGVLFVVLLIAGVLGLGLIGLGAVAAVLWYLAPIKNDGQPNGQPVTEVVENTAPAAATAEWVQLFNGKDLTGWKTHPDEPGDWRVEGSVLVGRGPRTSYLFSDRGNYGDFHLRVEAKLDAGGNSGVCFRSGFELISAGDEPGLRLPPGFEADINDTPNQAARTGTLWRIGPGVGTLVLVKEALVPPDTWFQLEVTAVGPRITVKVNGRTTADWMDDRTDHRTGHIALQVNWPDMTTVRFRKIEIKELPPSSPLPSAFKNSLGMEFVKVPKGKSWLGGGSGVVGEHGVEPVRGVEIAQDFYLGKYEVTQEEWQKVMGKNPSSFVRTGEGKDSVKDVADADLGRFPVEGVSWDDCQEFIKRVNERTEETGWVYRLPTQSEWEYACRGGPLADKRESTFDFYGEKSTNQLQPDQANIVGKGRTCKVGSYKPNKLGLYDMHGNVWEWCEDIFDAKDAKDPALATLRAIRGGCWVDGPENCRAAVRHGTARSLRSHLFGLRVARVPSGVSAPEAKTPPPALFTDADVKRISALSAAEQIEEVRKELKKRNPEFDGQLRSAVAAEPRIVDGVVVDLAFQTDHVSDISPLRALTGLHTLGCAGSERGKGMLVDLSPLRVLPLTALYVGGNPHLADLSAVRGKPINSLSIWGTSVESIEIVKDMPIKRLWLEGTKIVDISPLAGKSLDHLSLNLLVETNRAGLPAKEIKSLLCSLAQVPDEADLQRLGVKELALWTVPATVDPARLKSLGTRLTKINGKPVEEFLKELEQK
jgi:formylglycine-generating enzyme required for sulfatase activity